MVLDLKEADESKHFPFLAFSLLRKVCERMSCKHCKIILPICSKGPQILIVTTLKYGSQEIIPFWCRCSILLGPTFVEIKNSFTETLLTFNSKNFRIICYWKKSDESAPI